MKTATLLKVDLSQERLKELLFYNESDGIFRRIASMHSGLVGREAGCVYNKGYLVIGVDGTKYLAHRLAWFYVHGVWPMHQIDHINGVRLDNRIANLRDVLQSTNLQNQSKPNKRNKLGVLGVSQEGGRFRVKICTNGVKLNLGSFDTLQEARNAYIGAKQELHAEALKRTDTGHSTFPAAPAVCRAAQAVAQGGQP